MARKFSLLSMVMEEKRYFSAASLQEYSHRLYVLPLLPLSRAVCTPPYSRPASISPALSAMPAAY